MFSKTSGELTCLEKHVSNTYKIFIWMSKKTFNFKFTNSDSFLDVSEVFFSPFIHNLQLVPLLNRLAKYLFNRKNNLQIFTN